MINPRSPLRRVAVLGAGAIGCYVGACWASALASAGVGLTLIGRASTFDGFRTSGLHLTGSADMMLDVSKVQLADQPDLLADADLILLAMKATGLSRAIDDVAAHARPGTPLVCLLNGVAPARDLAAALPGHPVLAGMVPFNVVWQGPDHLHRSSAGDLALQRSAVTGNLASLIADSPLVPQLHDDLLPVQYGKLLLNLINPINALAGIALHQMLSQRGYRRIYAATLSEALQVYDAAGVAWQNVAAVSPRVARHLLTCPDALFNATLLKLQKIDPAAMTSMATDLMGGARTEIDVINGEIAALAAANGLSAPINARLIRLIKTAEADGKSPQFTSVELAAALSL